MQSIYKINLHVKLHGWLLLGLLCLNACTSSGMQGIGRNSLSSNSTLGSARKPMHKPWHTLNTDGPYSQLLPLGKAIIEGNRAMVACLMADDRMDINNVGSNSTSLLLALYKKNEPMVRLLLDKRPSHKVLDFTTQDALKRTPLHLAIEQGFKDLAKYMLEKLPDTSCLYVQDSKQRTPLHLAIEQGYEHLSNAIAAKIGHNSLSLQDAKQRTLLHLAIEQGFEYVAWLLLHNLPVDDPCLYIQDSKQRTPLHLAIEEGYEHLTSVIVSIIGEDGLYVQDAKQRTPLHTAVHNNRKNEFKLVLDQIAKCCNYDNDKIFAKIFEQKNVEGYGFSVFAYAYLPKSRRSLKVTSWLKPQWNSEMFKYLLNTVHKHLQPLHFSCILAEMDNILDAVGKQHASKELYNVVKSSMAPDDIPRINELRDQFGNCKKNPSPPGQSALLHQPASGRKVPVTRPKVAPPPPPPSTTRRNTPVTMPIRIAPLPPSATRQSASLTRPKVPPPSPPLSATRRNTPVTMPIRIAPLPPSATRQSASLTRPKVPPPPPPLSATGRSVPTPAKPNTQYSYSTIYEDAEEEWDDEWDDTSGYESDRERAHIFPTFCLIKK